MGFSMHWHTINYATLTAASLRIIKRIVFVIILLDKFNVLKVVEINEPRLSVIPFDSNADDHLFR